MVSISLCGFLMVLLGRLCSDCFVIVLCVSVTLLLVCRLCLESYVSRFYELSVSDICSSIVCFHFIGSLA